MRVEHVRPRIVRVTLHAYQMAALTAAARWVADGAEGELNPEVREQLRDVLAGYDEALRRAKSASEGN